MNVSRVRAGIIKNIHPHSFRHTFATDLYRNTKNLRLAQKALGYADISTTQIYSHIVDDELEDALKNLRNGHEAPNGRIDMMLRKEPDMDSEKTLKVAVDGVKVEGKIVFRSESDIDVEITKPYKNLSTGLHIPYFARPVHSYKGEYGDETALYLLKELYPIADYLAKNMADLQAKLKAAKEEVDALASEMVGDTKFLKHRAELRSRLRNGELDNHAYQKELMVLMKKKKEFNNSARDVMRSFFADNFPMGISFGMQEPVLEVLEGKRRIR